MVHLNNVYNTSFYSSPLWDITSREYTKLEKSWNVSQRVMMNLPRTTHRFFIEPLTSTQHIGKSLKRRLVKFVSKVKESSKSVLRHMLYEIEGDCRSTTGRNIRSLLLEYQISKLSEIDIASRAYKGIPSGEEWKIPLVKELVDATCGDLEVTNFNPDQLREIAELVCST